MQLTRITEIFDNTLLDTDSILEIDSILETESELLIWIYRSEMRELFKFLVI